MFITFEGIDGSGKSTQIDLTAEWLKAQGFNVVVTRDPGGTPLGKQIRSLLLDRTRIIYPECEMFLYLADRSQHVHELIKPSLDSGKIVLCDRYVDSTIAYQGYGRGIDISKIISLNDIATVHLKPKITFIFDLDIETAISRVHKAGIPDRLEKEDGLFWNRVRQGYLSLAQTEPDRCCVIPADQEKQVLFELIKKRIMPLISQSSS